MKRVNKKDKDSILMVKAKTKDEIIHVGDKKISLKKLSKHFNKVAIKTATQNMHPTAEQRKDLKNVSKEEFTRYVRKCGSSGHIGVSKHWVNKYVKVTMEEILD